LEEADFGSQFLGFGKHATAHAAHLGCETNSVSNTMQTAAERRPLHSGLKASAFGFVAGLLGALAAFSPKYGLTPGVLTSGVINGLVWALLFFAVRFVWVFVTRRRRSRQSTPR
jgi:NhaP-type Na+/H+ or K+/H+ antiporter